MIIQLLSIAIVVIVVFFIMKQQHKKDNRYFNKKSRYTGKEKRILEKYRKEYEAIAQDKRLSTLQNDHWELEDIAKSATEIIYDSPLPTKIERNDLSPGDLVKLKFRIGEDEDVERMWVAVQGKKEGLYFGSLDNEPFGAAELDEGQTIWFHPNHVFQIDKRME